jgi:hypothetical protein
LQLKYIHCRLCYLGSWCVILHWKTGNNNKSNSRRFSYLPPTNFAPNHLGLLTSGPLKRGFILVKSLSCTSFNIESTTRSTSCLLICCCNCSSSHTTLRISTLLVSPSTNDKNTSLRFFYICSSF